MSVVSQGVCFLWAENVDRRLERLATFLPLSLADGQMDRGHESAKEHVKVILGQT